MGGAGWPDSCDNKTTTVDVGILYRAAPHILGWFDDIILCWYRKISYFWYSIISFDDYIILCWYRKISYFWYSIISFDDYILAQAEQICGNKLIRTICTCPLPQSGKCDPGVRDGNGEEDGNDKMKNVINSPGESSQSQTFSLIWQHLLSLSDFHSPSAYTHQMFRCSDVHLFTCSLSQCIYSSDVQMFRCSLVGYSKLLPKLLQYISLCFWEG